MAIRTIFITGIVLLGTLPLVAGGKEPRLKKRRHKSGKFTSKINEFNIYRKLKKKNEAGNLNLPEAKRLRELTHYVAQHQPVQLLPQDDRHYADIDYDSDDELELSMKEMELNTKNGKK